LSDIIATIEIPSDNDGFVLFQCPLCGEYFKVTPSDYEDDGVLEIFCPACGLASDNYITEDVFNLAQAIAKNYAMDLLFNEMNQWERKSRKSMVTFKAGKKPKPEHESPIHATIESLTKTYFPCCKRNAKIKPMLRISGCCCPFCGVKEYEPE